MSNELYQDLLNIKMDDPVEGESKVYISWTLDGKKIKSGFNIEGSIEDYNNVNFIFKSAIHSIFKKHNIITQEQELKSLFGLSESKNKDLE